MRNALRDLYIAAGERAARDAFKEAYRAVRRPVIMGGGMPVPDSVRDQLWASKEALKAMGLHTVRWETSRVVDFDLICERNNS